MRWNFLWKLFRFIFIDALPKMVSIFTCTWSFCVYCSRMCPSITSPQCSCEDQKHDGLDTFGRSDQLWKQTNKWDFVLSLWNSNKKQSVSNNKKKQSGCDGYMNDRKQSTYQDYWNRCLCFIVYDSETSVIMTFCTFSSHFFFYFFYFFSFLLCNLRIPDQNGLSRLYTVLEIYHSGPEPLI